MWDTIGAVNNIVAVIDVHHVLGGALGTASYETDDISPQLKDEGSEK